MERINYHIKNYRESHLVRKGRCPKFEQSFWVEFSALSYPCSKNVPNEKIQKLGKKRKKGSLVSNHDMILSSSGFSEIEDQFIFQGAKCSRDSLLPVTIKGRTPRMGPCHSLPLYLTLYSLRQILCAGPVDFRLRES